MLIFLHVIALGDRWNDTLEHATSILNDIMTFQLVVFILSSSSGNMYIFWYVKSLYA